MSRVSRMPAKLYDPAIDLTLRSLFSCTRPMRLPWRRYLKACLAWSTCEAGQPNFSADGPSTSMTPR